MTTEYIIARIEAIEQELSELKKELSIQKIKKSWYQSFREKMIKENPELANRTRDDILREFDKLSDKIAQNIKFKSLEDMEQFMRREEFDPRRF